MAVKKKQSFLPPDSIPAKMLADLKKIFTKKPKFDKKFFLSLIPLLIFAWLGNKLYYAYRIYGFSMEMMTGINSMLINPIPSFTVPDMAAGLITAAAVKIYLNIKKKNKKNYRDKEEYGSARWGTQADIEPYVDTDNPTNNIILTKTESLTMNSRVPNPKYARNKNILVVGGSGSGKTRFFVKPNIMQMHSSYVVTDPKGTIVLECGKMLQNAGYRIKVINTINMDKSMHYNPFAYLHSEEDILNLANTIITNTKGDGDKSGEDFWVKAERLLYVSFIALIYYEFPEEERNFGTLLWLINQCETREDDETFKNRVDLTFEMLEQKKGEDHFAVRQYKKYKLAAGKTAKSILISCGARLAPFDIDKVRKMMEYDEMELDTLGDPNQKTALFVIVSDTSATYNFIVAMLYTQLFNLLCTVADDKYGGRLPTHVRCLLDEFANIGQIPNFEKLIATIRSREISASIILQSKSQLKAIYKDNADTIIGNCDTELFLGGKEKSTLKELSEILGKQTIDLFTTSLTQGQSPTSGTNYNKTGRELMSQDEIAVMDGGKCIVQIRGTRAFFSDKFDITRHERYKELSDFDPKNTFDITGYVKGTAKIKKTDEIEIMSRMVC